MSERMDRPQSRAALERDGPVALLSVALERGAGAPLVWQLYNQLRELILAQRLAAGTRLPSTRKLSRDLGVSRTVTFDAFAQLAAEGFLETRPGAGHFVAALQLPEPGATPRSQEVAQRGEVSAWSPAGRPFDPAWQAVDLFPAQLWSRMLGRGWRRQQGSVLERHWAGLPALRTGLAKHLHALRGIMLSSEQVLITSGNADALALIARSLEGLGDAAPQAWVEDPGYGASAQILAREGLKTVPVPVDSEGLQVEAGERLAPDAALALVTATRQFPLGMPLTLSRRLALLEWARRSGAIIIEDDYDGEIRFAGRPLQSLASLDPVARVLTIGSFSKLTFPGLRLGYIAGPADIIVRLTESRRRSQALVPTSGQAAFAELIATGSFARHLRRLRTQLTRRRLLLVEALREAGDLVEVLPQEVGMHLTVRLAPKLTRLADDVALSERAAELGLVLMPLSQQFAGRRGEQGFLLGYGGWDERELSLAIRNFTGLLRDSARG
jgi:GntR family transcriptional regulator/MocR family aminotransferase